MRYSGVAWASPAISNRLVRDGCRSRWCDALISSRLYYLLEVGAKVVVDVDGGSVEGRISALLSALDERTRRVPVVVDFESPGRLRAGDGTIPQASCGSTEESAEQVVDRHAPTRHRGLGVGDLSPAKYRRGCQRFG